MPKKYKAIAVPTPKGQEFFTLMKHESMQCKIMNSLCVGKRTINYAENCSLVDDYHGESAAPWMGST